MADIEDFVDLRFRLFDGTDIGPNKYDPSTCVASLKEVIVSTWPKGLFLQSSSSNYAYDLDLIIHDVGQTSRMVQRL